MIRASLALPVALLTACAPNPQASRAAPSSAGSERTLLELPASDTKIASWMKGHGWRAQRGDPSEFRIGPDGLRMVASGNSVSIGTERGFPISVQDWPRLRFAFRIETLPEGTDLAKASTEDAAFRLFVVFDRDRGLLHPPHTIGYAWTEKGRAGDIVQSSRFEQVQYLCVGSGPTSGWTTVERDLAADYRRCFPRAKGDVPAVQAVMLKCDGNNTDSAAASTVRSVALLR